MFKLSKSVEYALFALKYIDEHCNNEKLSARIISDKMNIPYELTAKILQKLVKNGILISQKGTRGGYSFTKSKEYISLSEIIYAIHSEYYFMDCGFEGADENYCNKISNCVLRIPMLKIQKKINAIFEETTLKDII